MSTPIETSRFTFPEDRTTFVYGAPGQPIRTPPRTGIKVFTDEACTQPADILTTGGVPIPWSTIYTADDSLLPEFLGPPGFLSQLWARVVGGTATSYPLFAVYSERLSNLPYLLSGDGPPTDDIGAVGSFYIDRGRDDNPNTSDNPYIYGPRTVDGWPTEGTRIRGPRGDPGAKQIWIQELASATWEIIHTLDGRPDVTTIDLNGDVMYGDINYPSRPDMVVVRFGSPERGTAILT